MMMRVPERMFRCVGLRAAGCVALVSALSLCPTFAQAEDPLDLPVLKVDGASPEATASQCTADSCSLEVEQPVEPPKHAWLTQHPTIQKLLKLNNAERTRVGRTACVLDPDLCLAAQQHAQWMATTGYYSHSSMGYPEIIFSGPLTAEAANQGWIYSPAHHSIMLSGQRAGFGYAVQNGRTYWVGLFLH